MSASTRSSEVLEGATVEVDDKRLRCRTLAALRARSRFGLQSRARKGTYSIAEANKGPLRPDWERT